MSQQITISFVGTIELKSLLEKWAKQDDRSISSVMRKILAQEALRRKQPSPEGGSQKSNA